MDKVTPETLNIYASPMDNGRSNGTDRAAALAILTQLNGYKSDLNYTMACAQAPEIRLAETALRQIEKEGGQVDAALFGSLLNAKHFAELAHRKEVPHDPVSIFASRVLETLYASLIRKELVKLPVTAGTGRAEDMTAKKQALELLEELPGKASESDNAMQYAPDIRLAGRALAHIAEHGGAIEPAFVAQLLTTRRIAEAQLHQDMGQFNPAIAHAARAARELVGALVKRNLVGTQVAAPAEGIVR